MSRAGWIGLGLVIVLAAGAGACDLNPQPLPPIVDDERASENGEGAGAGNGGSFEQAPPAADPSAGGVWSDAGTAPPGDAGDTDAAPDAG